MIDLLKSMKLKFRIIDKDDNDELDICKNAYEESNKNKSPLFFSLEKVLLKNSINL